MELDENAWWQRGEYMEEIIHNPAETQSFFILSFYKRINFKVLEFPTPNRSTDRPSVLVLYKHNVSCTNNSNCKAFRYSVPQTWGFTKKCVDFLGIFKMDKNMNFNIS